MERCLATVGRKTISCRAAQSQGRENVPSIEMERGVANRAFEDTPAGLVVLSILNRLDRC
jgi:hypothetical protein